MVFHRWAGILLCLLGHKNTPGGCSVFYAVYSVVISIVLSLFWPVVQTGINNFGIWIANSSETSPILAPFIYGTLERLLLPFGLHHMLTIPMQDWLGLDNAARINKPSTVGQNWRWRLPCPAGRGSRPRWSTVGRPALCCGVPPWQTGRDCAIIEP